MITLFETKKIAFILAFAAHAVFFVLMDPDYYLHLMAGKYIVEHLSLPTGDVFSYTMVGQPWHLHEWLFEVLIYCIYILSGETGVVVWTSGLGVLAFYIAFNAGNPNNKGNYRAILFALLLFVFYQVFIKPRPQVITFLCYAIFLFVLFDFKYRNTLRFSFVLPPLMVVWTNVHGAYLLGIALLFLFTALFSFWFLWVPPSDRPPGKIVIVKRGMHLRQISHLLEAEGIIRNSHVFVLVTTVLGKKAKIKAGEYEFQSRLNPLGVLDTLVRGQVKRHLVTIPEGYTLSQIAQIMDDQKIVGKKEFLQKASSPALFTSLGLSSIPAGSDATLEGYLFPETYHLYKEMDPEEVIRMMVNQFKKNFGTEQVTRASEPGWSEREAVILASIIEKETSLPEEKPLVSAVFHNRLAKKIPLQSDPTVIYGIKDFNGNLTREDLLRPTPYNTYLRPGLPPSPICNPGKDSLLAALHPAPVPYLYFVSKNDGSHYFSVGIEDHNRAVWRYQKQGRRK